jgi:hypothetical protein
VIKVKCDYESVCCKMALEIRDLISEEASDAMLGAMVGEPGECFGFALEWIKKQKGLPHHKEWFNQEKLSKT